MRPQPGQASLAGRVYDENPPPAWPSRHAARTKTPALRHGNNLQHRRSPRLHRRFAERTQTVRAAVRSAAASSPRRKNHQGRQRRRADGRRRRHARVASDQHQLVVYFTFDPAGNLAAAAQHRVAVSDEVANYWLDMLGEQAARACNENRVQIAQMQQNRLAMAIAVERPGMPPDALAAVFLPAGGRPESLLVTLQLVAGLLSAYHLQHQNQAADWELSTASPFSNWSSPRAKPPTFATPACCWSMP